MWTSYVSAVMPPFAGTSKHQLLFCFPLFNCSRTPSEGEGTRRSVAGHGPVYSLTLGCWRHLHVPCETLKCVSSGSIAQQWRVVKRSVLSPCALPPHVLACLQLAGLCEAQTTSSSTLKRAKEFIRSDKALGRHDP